MKDTHPFINLLSGAIGGAAIVQNATHQALIESVTDIDAGLTAEIHDYFCNELGLDFDGIAYNALTAMYVKLTLEDIKEASITTVARILWYRLGSPDINGAKPPPIYVQTAAVLYNWLLDVLDPDFDPPLSQN